MVNGLDMDRKGAIPAGPFVLFEFYGLVKNYTRRDDAPAPESE